MGNFYFFILVSIFINSATSEPGYLKFCGDEHKHVIHSTSCLKGIWLNVPIKPGCVCASGVWALSNGLCDKKAAIIVGEHHCFHVDFEVQSVKFIGNPIDPFEPSIHTAPLDMDAVYEIPENGLTPQIHSDHSIVIGINPKRPLERGDRSFCVQVSEKNRWKPVHIYMNPSRSTNKWHYGTKAKCSNNVDYTHHIGFGEMFRSSKIVSKEVIGRQCQDKCPPLYTPSLRLGRGMSKEQKQEVKKLEREIPGLNFPTNIPTPAPKEVDVNLSKNITHSTLTRNKPLLPPTLQELLKEKSEQRAALLLDLDDYHQEINEQTLRMMHAQISPILLNEPNNEISTREYAYFQKARLVVERLCPSDFVPQNLVRGLMRMFKQLLWESADHERPHNQAGDETQFDRIMTILDNCTKNITETERFSYYNYTGSFNFTGKNETDEEWPKPEQCPEPLIYGVWGKNMDGEYTVLQNVTGGFHPYLKFNMSLVDFVIETAWKTVMIAHYQCSKSFNDTTAGDFASFFHQMELFFNEKIVKRWYDPQNVNSTLEILELIFPTYDLKRFAFGIDVCLFAAQQYTDYGWNSKWIQRPKIPFTLNELRQERYTIPGMGSPISTNDYAPKALMANAEEEERKKRKKRDLSMWRGKGRCMNNFVDPVVSFGYLPKSGCKLEKS